VSRDQDENVEQDPKKKPTVRMTDDEARALLEQSLVGIFTTLRRDGRPVAMPVWFVALDGNIYVSTRGKKVTRVRNDPRASFLVETGDRWADLQAVHLDCRATVIEPSPQLAARIREALDEKYRAYRTAQSAMPTATKEHYRHAAGAIIELVPEKMLTWDNRKLGLS
jgi:nitroimidazol reductase NimA-like FMN-containing flavoprotein (pyridoxamine 5'-phosphate oxidase superfamily)